MAKKPRKNYDYSRPGVAMITLQARPGIRLCEITQERFTVSDVGRAVQEALPGIRRHYPQIKIGQYQIMPDHLHAMVHLVRKLPDGVTLQRVIRGFKLGVNRACREAAEAASFRVFEKGMYDSLVFDRAHLEREVAYIRDNVRRYRLRKANPDMFRKPRRVRTLPDGTPLRGFGNHFLLDHPRRIRIELSRRTTEEEWRAMADDLAFFLKQGYVFVSPFISPCEKRVLRDVVKGGGRAIRITHAHFGPRYKPAGELFDMCYSGRLLEVSVAEAFPRYARLDRAVCLKLNEVAGLLATTQWLPEAG